MFHEQRIAAKKAALEKKIQKKLTEYPVEYSILQYEKFKRMERTDGRRVWYQRVEEDAESFKFTKEEAEFIQNEKYMCSISFPYWFYRYFFIKDMKNEVRRPEILFAQQVYLAILAELDLQRLPIKLLILKARQLGMSTITEAIILWIALHIFGSHCVIASAQEDKSEKMSEMVWLGIEMLPLWMKPILTRENVKQGPAFGEIKSDVLIQHGATNTGIGRGDTPIAAHLSEIPYYLDPEESIESSLLNAMHENSKTFVVLEGTARRKGDWWHERWLKEREGEKTGRSEFVCLFLPWYVGRDKYPTPDWLRNHPIPEGWIPLRETSRQATDAELYVATTPLLKKYMGDGWKMPIEQMWCWEHRYNLARRKDSTYKKFLAEFASDERSCFQSQRHSVFSQEVLDRLEQEQQKRFIDYAIVGDGIDKRFSLSEFHSQSLRRIDVEWRSLDGRVFRWKLIPLEKTPDEKSLQFYFRMFEPVVKGHKYTIGIDISSGQGQNRTVYSVNKKAKNKDLADVEAGLLCSPWISSPETPGFAHCLGVYYGQFMNPIAEARIAPETQRASGDFICGQLNKLGYINLFMMERWDLRRPPGYKAVRFGWTTTSWSQQLLKESFEHAIRTGWFKVNSPELVQELGWLEAEETDTGKEVYDHQKGKTDDVFVAAAISYIVSHSKDTIIERIAGDFGPKPPDQTTSPIAVRDTLQSRMSRIFMREEREQGWAKEEGEMEGNPYVY